MARTHPVHFDFHENGDIDYKPGLLHVRHNDKIKWTCNRSDFFIAFTIDGSPLDDTTYLGVGGVIDPQTVTTNQAGSFHYQVGAIVTLSKRGKKMKKLFMATGSPEIIVESF